MINKVQSTIVAFWRTFSVHLLVTVHIHPHILVKFKDTFLFCNKITTISITARTISVQVNIVSNILKIYLLNNSEYKIFKIVKIATAIAKFVHQLIWYVIFCIVKTSFIVFEINHNKIQFMKTEIIG